MIMDKADEKQKRIKQLEEAICTKAIYIPKELRRSEMEKGKMTAAEKLLDTRLLECRNTECIFNESKLHGEYGCRFKEIRINKDGACEELREV
jgi:hypothetical protein